MARKIFLICIAQTLVYQVFSANLHPALQQYLLSGLSQSSSSMSYPSVTITKQSNANNMQSLAALASLLSSQVPSMPVKPQSVPPSNSLLAAFSSDHSSASNPNLQSLAYLASLLSPSPKPHPVPPNSIPTLTPELPTSISNSVDASLLNNLAIALQLLLVSNIINTPQQEPTPEPLVVPGYPIHEFKEPVTPVSVSYANSNHQSQPVTATPMSKPGNHHNYDYGMQNMNYNPYESSHYPTQLPNANFVGSSTFADSSPFGGTIPPPSPSSSRGGFSLMSPYEALSPSSPYTDPILSSPFGSVMTSKKDFQSPYSSIMAADNKDLFSLSDFF